MCNRNWVLDDLTINVESNPLQRRSLTRQEIFVLAWFIGNQQGRTYRDIMRDCKLTGQQAQEAIQGLIDLDLLRSR